MLLSLLKLLMCNNVLVIQWNKKEQHLKTKLITVSVFCMRPVAVITAKTIFLSFVLMVLNNIIITIAAVVLCIAMFT